MANINIMDFEYKSYDVGIDINDVSCLSVSVVSGDEILTVCLRDGSRKTFDAQDFSGDHRLMNFEDYSYSICNKIILVKWLRRPDTYHFLINDDELEEDCDGVDERRYLQN